MIHVTMQTGHAADIPPPAPEAVAALVPLLADGGGDLGAIVPACRGVVLRTCKRPWPGALSWDVSRGGDPIALCVMCADAAAQATVWAVIERQYLRLSDKRPDLYAPGACPEMPDKLPWLATLILPGAALHMDVLDWLADCDQCVAYAALGMVSHG